MREDDAKAGWKIVDTRNDAIVARIAADASGTRLTWVEDAGDSSPAASLIHGRLTNETGSVIYLRPTIEAESWPIDLQRADVRPTWDLRWPIPPRISRLAIEFDVPEEIEIRWLEPIQPTELRRTRGLAVLTPQDSETVALGMRLDVGCGRKLSVRVRFAARLARQCPGKPCPMRACYGWLTS